MEMRSEDYVHKLDGDLCAFCIDPYDGDYWILGDAFMRGFYAVHDHDNARFGFVPHKLSPTKQAPVAGTVPIKLIYNDPIVIEEEPEDEGLSKEWTWASVVALLIIVGGIAALIWYCPVLFLAPLLGFRKVEKTPKQVDQALNVVIL